jgi:hypothetical protein
LAASARATSVEQVVDAVIALHSTDATSVYLSAAARLKKPSFDAIERALYDDRTVLRMLGMRRTVFVVGAATAPVIQAACTREIAAVERKRLIALVEEFGVARDGTKWLRSAEKATLAALEARGEATASDLTADVPALAARISVNEGKKYAGEIGMNTRVLFLLAADGHIVRARPRGSWTSSQYRWAPAPRWFEEDLHAHGIGEARAELARRWLSRFGPATVGDLKWWTGWTMGETKKALLAIDLVEADLDGLPGIALADDVDPIRAPRPWAALLPALDPTPMGWADRDWYLGEHKAALFDRSGNIGPTVWWDGRIVGGWAQRADGEIAYRLLEDVGRAAVTAVEKEAERLGTFIGDVRFKARFRTPLEHELSA